MSRLDGAILCKGNSQKHQSFAPGVGVDQARSYIGPNRTDLQICRYNCLEPLEIR